MAHVSPEVANAITRQKTRYARYADTKQWDKWEHEVFHPTAKFAFLDVKGAPLMVGKKPLVFDSAKAIAAYYLKFFAEVNTMHNIGPGDFEQVAPDEVRAVFGVEDQVVSKALGLWASIRGGGYYYETWRLVDGQWRIADLRMERTYQEMSMLVKLIFGIVWLFGLSVE